MADTLAITKIGPEQNGLRMTLDEFRQAEFEEGYLYELAKGVVVVSVLPSYFHMLIVLAIRDAFIAYKHQNPGRIFAVAGGGDSGVEMPEMQSRRHPDVSVYLTPPPFVEAQPWDSWTPEIAIEVVSESSRERDYEEKADEYLKGGVRLYWIVDPLERTVTVLTRRADAWRRQKLDDTGTLTTGLLPGFSLSLAEALSVVSISRQA